MTAAFAARASRQSMIGVAVVGLHVGLLVVMAAATNLPPPPDGVPKPIRITNLPPPPKPVFERPELPDPLRVEPGTVPQPPLDIPAIADHAATQDAIRAPAGQHAARDSANPASIIQSPRQRTRDGRLAALVDACYPSASRRLGEEGRAVVRVTIAADGGTAAWSVAQSSGFARLDAAASCVLRRLEFEPGRRDGRAVDTDILLPIAFQLN